MSQSQTRAIHASSGDLIADRRFAWGEAAARDGDHAAAIDLFTQTLELAPDWAPGWLALGEARQKLGDIEGAREAFACADALDMDGQLGARLRLSALGAGEAPAVAPAAYVRDLFDQYAARFDAHLTGALAYRGPEVLRSAVESIAPGRRFNVMLDLGCGTGLAARAFTDRVGAIDGVDLSPAMIEEARKTGLYRRLVAGELVAFLNECPAGGADLAVAADVFVYMGDLAATFEAARRALTPGGLFVFTTQASETGDWRVGADLRYAHSAAYLRAAAARAGLVTRMLDPVSTRRDAGVDVPGLACVLARP
jgi:predicted TPR repeat methyltransferase